jgi:predicted NBD/HSP70 family sugar kinase
MNNADRVVIALDMGGTWIKGAVCAPGASRTGFEIARWRNPLETHTTAEDYADYIVGRCRELAAGRPVCAVVASTAGEVDAAGQRYRIAGAHLKAMATTPWRARAELALGCPFTLINDAEAFVLGLAESGQLSPDRNVGALVVGTGLGFSVVRQGRWWKPERRLNFLGSAWSVDGTYDAWASAVGAASGAGGDLVAFLSDPRHEASRAAYLEGLARMLASAGILYHLDEVVLGGGLVEAAEAGGLDLPQVLGPRLRHLVPPVFEAPRLILAAAGNRILLHGGLAMAMGNAAAEGVRYRGDFLSLGTEGERDRAGVGKANAGGDRPLPCGGRGPGRRRLAAGSTDAGPRGRTYRGRHPGGRAGHLRGGGHQRTNRGPGCGGDPMHLRGAGGSLCGRGGGRAGGRRADHRERRRRGCLRRAGPAVAAAQFPGCGPWSIGQRHGIFCALRPGLCAPAGRLDGAGA